MTDSILVFIPAYNCEKQISRVLQQFRGLDTYFKEILVVDNRSPDNTVQAAQHAATALQIPVKVVRNEDNYGLGGSHKAAFAYAAEQGYDYCIVLHGDDQGSIQDVLPLLGAGLHRQHDCLLGARFMPGARLHGYSRFRTFGNLVFNTLFSLVAGRKLYDLGSGLNLYRVERLKQGPIAGFANNLTFNYYMILATVFWRWDIHFFPISWREDDQVSNVKLSRQALQVLGILLTFIFRKKLFFQGNHSGRSSAEYPFSVVEQYKGIQEKAV